MEKRFEEIKKIVASIRDDAVKGQHHDLIFIKGSFAGLRSWIQVQMEFLDDEIMRRQIAGDPKPEVAPYCNSCLSQDVEMLSTKHGLKVVCVSCGNEFPAKEILKGK